jgi:uroporphyrinogen decarboxylase
VHGEDVMFDLLADYPVSLVNWHDRLTAPTLRDALKRFPKLLVGGVEENRTLTRGPHDAIRDEVREAIAQTGGRRLMIGPGCVLLVATPDAHIQAAVDAAHSAPAR